MFAAKDLIATKGGYKIGRSLRFRSSASAYLSRTPAGAGTSTKTWTYSAWIKRGTLGGTVDLISARSAANPLFYFQIVSDQINIFARNSGGTTIANYTSAAVFRDPSAWYHIVLKWDALTSTMGLYVNNVLQTLTTATAISNVDYAMNTAIVHEIGRSAYGASDYFDGYMAEIYMIDGQALTPSSFGETDATTGVWKPKAYTGGSYGTNGFYLKFADNSGATATTIGKDSSGNGNNWTPNNISVTAGTTYDSMIDTPTPYDDGGNGVGNYCVLNPTIPSGDAKSNGNLTVNTSTTAYPPNPATIAISSGAYYWEVTVTTSPSTNASDIGIIGITNSSVTNGVGGNTTGYSYYGNTGNKLNNSGTGAAYGSSYTTGDVIGVAFDATNGKLWFAKNNIWQASGSPSTGANAAFTGITGSYYPAVAKYTSTAGGVLDVNFGQRPFTYTPPSGFKALNTQNLPTPTIAAGNKYMDVLTWTGDNSSTGTTKNRTGLGFQPDLVWVKNRSNAYWHNLYDAVRTAGSSKNLSSNTTNAEGDSASIYGYISAFNSDGFTTTNGSDATSPGIWVNQNTQTFVAWNWKANGAGTVNNVGTIQSTVSANTTAGFSVVIYTGTLTGAPGTCPTVGHGLGVAPSLVISKSRNVTGVDSGAWFVWSANTGSTDNYLRLNTTAAVASVTGGGGGPMVAPTSTVFSTPYISGANINANNYVAYCFAAVAGYSAFGSYTGNGSTDGPFVFTGFRPRYIMIKNTADNTTSWSVWDTARSPYNVPIERLEANASAAESSLSQFDILSNGFKLRANNSNNASGQSIIYAAFAETPFSKALAR